MTTMIVTKSGKTISNEPTQKELEKLSIDDLVGIAKSYRSQKHPFKAELVKYFVKRKKIC